MDRDIAFQTVARYLTRQFEIPAEKITPQARLFADLELDSIDALDMIGTMETELGIGVVEGELQGIRTVEDVVQYLVRHVPAAR